MKYHEPVLLNEALDFLVTKEDGIYFDATIGFGGHTESLLKRLNRKGIVIGSDKDSEAFNYSKKKFNGEERVKLYNASFTDIKSIAKIEFIDKFDGILADLGVSSYQLDNPESGFTFRKDVPLDLRMDKSASKTASDLVNTLEENELIKIFREFGEEKAAKKIASKIIERRSTKRIETTFQLKEIVASIIPPNYLNKSLSRVFQSLRIAVNNELEELKKFIPLAVDLLRKRGRIVVISYHSLEDRIVKESFKYETLQCVCPKDYPVCICNKEVRLKLISRKPIKPSAEEIKKNRRARSAKMRVAERV